ncbi:hypothetical protein Tco_1463473 [Tanacetum coccineum]
MNDHGTYNSVQSQRGKAMLHGLGIKFYWLKHKEMVKFLMRKNWNSCYGLDVLFEVPISDNTNNDMLNQCARDAYLIESQNVAVQDTNSSTQQDALILPVFEQLLNQATNCNKVNNDNLIANESLSAELERYKE